MPTMTGYLRDFTTAGMPPELSPVIVFTPTSAGTTGSVILADRAVEVTPTNAVLGSFSVNLQGTDQVQPATWYQVTVKWLDGEGVPVGFAEIPGKLRVPNSGGRISDHFLVSGAPGLLWVGLTPPPAPGPYTHWAVDNPALPGVGTPPPGFELGDVKEWIT